MTEYLNLNKDRFLDELLDLLRIPSVSADPKFKDDVLRTAEYVAKKLEDAGAQNVELCKTAGNPIVYGEYIKDPALPTVLVYGHYDVQPADPYELWTSPPFELFGGWTMWVCQGQTVELRTLSAFSSYRWSTGEATRTARAEQPGIYWVEVAHQGCLLRDTLELQPQDCSLLIPNVITPNGDQVNDAFEIIGLEKSRLRLHLYNRWGSAILTVENYRNDWDGNGLTSGIYYYLLEDTTTGLTYKGYVQVLK